MSYNLVFWGPVILEEQADFWLNVTYSDTGIYTGIYQEKHQKVFVMVFFTEVYGYYHNQNGSSIVYRCNTNISYHQITKEKSEE